jgi:hypothetical protein
MGTFFDDMVKEALALVIEKNINIYTFAYYHDHESSCIGIGIDTEENSNKLVKSSNEFTKKYFYRYLEDEDLNSLKSFCFNAGRSFYLGDYTYRNIVYKKIPEEYKSSKKMYLEMIKAINSNKEDILKFSDKPENIFFSCSSEDNEVEYIWQ